MPLQPSKQTAYSYSGLWVTCQPIPTSRFSPWASTAHCPRLCTPEPHHLSLMLCVGAESRILHVPLLPFGWSLPQAWTCFSQIIAHLGFLQPHHHPPSHRCRLPAGFLLCSPSLSSGCTAISSNTGSPQPLWFPHQGSCLLPMNTFCVACVFIMRIF